MQTITVKQPKQIVEGSYAGGTRKQFIPLPIKKSAHIISDWAFDCASSMAGEGKLLASNEAENTQRFLLLIEDGTFNRGNALPGDWIIDYTLHRENGIEDCSVYLAAQIV